MSFLKNVLSTAMLLLLAGCSREIAGPWPKAYQAKFGQSSASAATNLYSDGRGHLLAERPSKDAPALQNGRQPMEYTAYDLQNRICYKWLEGNHGFHKTTMKPDEKPAWFVTRETIEGLKKSGKCLGEKKIEGVTCLGANPGLSRITKPEQRE